MSTSTRQVSLPSPPVPRSRMDPLQEPMLDIASRSDTRWENPGTGAYHVGEDPDERTLAVLEKHGVPVSCQARKVGLSDFKDFAYIFAMDSQNLNNLERLQPKESKARSELEYCPLGPLSLCPLSRSLSIDDAS